MCIELRPATLGDVSLLLSLQKEAFEENYLKYKDATSPYCESVEAIKAKIRLSSYYVILDHSAPVGGIFAYRLDDDHYKLNGLYIAPAFQRMGVGKKALRMFMDEHPARKWSIEIPTDSEKRRAFLSDYGFVPTDMTERVNDRLTLRTYEYED